jgi:hypothetical protein
LTASQSGVAHILALVAKRNVRRARVQGRTTDTPAASPPPARPTTFRSRHFWLGVVAAACVLIPVAIAGVLLARESAGSGSTEQAARSRQTPEPTPESEQKRLQRITETRDKEQVQDLTTRMRQWSDDLDPVLRGVAKTLPPESAKQVGPLADRAEVEDWRRKVKAAEQFFAESVSGDTGTNVARGALAASIRGLAEMLETYKLALSRDDARAELLERVRVQRDNAMAAWETASIQMDVINIAVGYGHQHPPAPGSGGKLPDALPEGTDATEEG